MLFPNLTIMYFAGLGYGLGYGGYGLGYAGYGLGGYGGHAVWKREAEAEPSVGYGYGGKDIYRIVR